MFSKLFEQYNLSDYQLGSRVVRSRYSPHVIDRVEFSVIPEPNVRFTIRDEFSTQGFAVSMADIGEWQVLWKVPSPPAIRFISGGTMAICTKTGATVEICKGIAYDVIFDHPELIAHHSRGGAYCLDNKWYEPTRYRLLHDEHDIALAKLEGKDVMPSICTCGVWDKQ